MILVMPVMDGHDWTRRTTASMAATVSGTPPYLVVVDNDSEDPYVAHEFGDMHDARFSLMVHRASRNLGYYASLFLSMEYWRTGPARGRRVYESEDLLGLVHNDVLFHESGWNERIEQCFRDDPKLGVLGFVGSYEVDDNGGRGAGTMCHFRSHDASGVLIGQSQEAGELIRDLRPSLVLDSLLMVFRRQAITDMLGEDANDLPLAHFYDKIWSLRLVQAGWRVGTLGVEISHWGGITLVANTRYVADCKLWCWERGVREVPNDDWQLQMYREGERRLLSEFKVPGGFVPSRILRDWSVGHGG